MAFFHLEPGFLDVGKVPIMRAESNQRYQPCSGGGGLSAASGRSRRHPANHTGNAPGVEAHRRNLAVTRAHMVMASGSPCLVSSCDKITWFMTNSCA